MPFLEGTRRQLRRHGDAMQRLPGGYYAALGRTDDSMNLGGVKVSRPHRAGRYRLHGPGPSARTWAGGTKACAVAAVPSRDSAQAPA